VNGAELKRRLVGRTIVKVELNAFRDGKSPKGGRKPRVTRDLFDLGPDGGAWTYDPAFHLDDGTVLRFNVHETEIGEHGIGLVLSMRPRRGA
jgi:hypothetical protein